MAITDHSIVAMKNTSTAFGDVGDWTAQPPINGIAYGGGEGGVFDVLWSNGLQSSSVPEAVLDLIIQAEEESLSLFGKTVTIGSSSSANYESVVVGVYDRNGDQVALLKSVASGVFREVPVDQVVVVPGH